jgi:UDP-4-amino-4,6-dideoxy-N-acetyl-beta-L-altrosamine transaminase
VIPYGRQSIDDEDIAAVVAVLQGDWLTQGPHIESFEHALAERIHARHVVAFANGTAALHGAAAASRLGPTDTVCTSPLSFIASANCARYVGAKVTFADIDPKTLNLDPAKIPGDATGLVAVHYAGLPLDLRGLTSRPRVVIEDAAHALGATTPDGPVGNCAHSDATVFSFHPVKAITTGEGGAVSTNDDEIAERLLAFRNHGIVRKPARGAWAYEISELGFNYRLTDIQAALGTSQLAKLDRFIVARQRLAERYRKALADLPVELPPEPHPGFSHAYHLFPVQVDRRDQVFSAMRNTGIGVQIHYIPISSQPLYRAASPPVPNADSAFARLLSLPLHPGLTTDEQDQVIGALAASL